jgi:RHS repeat-associated protein
VHSTLASIGGDYELVRRDRVRYRLRSDGRLTELRDRNGQGLTFAYDASARLQTITDSAGRAIALTTNASGQLTKLALPDGRSVAYAYTGDLLTSVTDMAGGTTIYRYDAGGRLSEIVDPNGNSVVRNTYGPDGRVTDQLDALGHRSTFAWDPATQTSTMTDARGGRWRDVYSNNVLIRVVDPLGNTVAYDYDAKLNRIWVTDPRGNPTNYSYDARGNLVRRTAPPPLSYQETFTYDAQDNLLSHTDGRGNKTEYTYDGAGNNTSIKKPGDVVTSFERAAGTGLLVSVTDPRQKTTRFDYDGQGNLLKTTSPTGDVTTLGFDGSGRRTSMVEPRGNVAGADPAQYRWSFVYDALDRTTSQTSPLGHTMASAYDRVGNRTSRTDANNRTVSYAYDAANHLTAVTAPDGTKTTYAYDATSNLTGRTDAKAHTTSYGYDAANRMTTLTNPIGSWSFAYDGAGNRSRSTVPGGGIITASYDALNRLTGIDYSDTTPDVGFGYDANGNRTSMSDGSGTVSYGYDALDRLTNVTRGSNTFSYSYDVAGNVASRTYPDNTATTYTYDAAGRLATAASGGLTTTYSYDPASNMVQTTLPAANGHVEVRSYDRDGRLVETKTTKGTNTLVRRSYALDAVGNPLTVTDQANSVTTYTYDALDQVTKACYATSSCQGATDFVAYAYDAVGNRTTETRPAGTTTYVYNAADQLTSQAGLNGALNFTYDARGNQTAAGARTFGYDLADRLSTTTSGRATTTYTYDGDGTRLQASSGAQAGDTTKYLWDTNGSLPQVALERNGSDALARRYIYGAQRISMTAGSATSYYHHDRLGSVTNVTGATGASQWEYGYEPFGKARTENNIDRKAPANPMKFAGELLDADTGLYHLRARQYDPSTGRFLSTDPLAPAITDPYVSSYVYAKNRSTLLTDPSGKVTYAPVCVAVNLNFILHVSFEACPLVIDDDGNIGTIFSFGKGVGTKSVGVSSGPEITNADTVRDLQGRYYYAGGSGLPFGEGVSGGVDVATFTDCANTRRWGVRGSVGVTASETPGTEGHGGRGHTWVIGTGGTACSKKPSTK